MKKYFSLTLAVFLLSASMVSAAALTQQQVDAVVGLLRSFGADTSAIANVQSLLGGTTPHQGASIGILPTRVGENPQCPDGYFENRISDTSFALGVTNLLLPSGVTKRYCAEFKPPIAPMTGDPLGVFRVSLYDESDQNHYSGGLKVQNPSGIIRGDNSVGVSGGTEVLFYSYVGRIQRPDQAPRGTYIITATGYTAGDARFRLGWDWQQLAPPGTPTEPKFDVGASVQIKPHRTLGDIKVYYRNDPLPDGKCGTVIGEKATGTSGVITQTVVYCGNGRYWKVRFTEGGEGWVIQNRIQPIAQQTTPPPPPPAASCLNNWNSSTGGYYQKPGTSCPCTYYDGQGRQTIGVSVSANCAPVVQTQSGLNFSPQRAGSPQAGRVVWSNEAGSNVYTGTDFPAGAEPSQVKTFPGGWLVCSPGAYISEHGFLVRASGGNDAMFKKNGRSEADGMYYWGLRPNGSYQWTFISLEEYHANPSRQYARAGWNGVPYAPNCVINTMVGSFTGDVPPPPPPPPAPVPPPPPAPLVLGTGASIRIKALPASTAGARYRNDPLPDGSCGAIDGEELVGARGTIISTRNVCTTDSRIRWKVRFTSGAEGWVTQNRLEVVSPTSRVPSASDPAIANTLEGLRKSIESLQNFIGQH